MQSMNGVNINHFQFEYDLTWMSFFQNHDGKTYVRYGGREDDGVESHLNKVSLLNTMNAALALHKAKQPREPNKYEPTGELSLTPNEIPVMKKMLAKRQVKCIHCHDVKGAQLREVRESGELKKEMVFTYPSPKNFGIQLDPEIQNRIKAIDAGSAAEKSGLRANDTLESFDGQPILTFADATRVLELAPESGNLIITATRDNNKFESEIKLPPGWRTFGDPSWRENTHVVGPNSGFWGVRLNPAERKSYQLADDSLALKATAIWGKWAREAGIKHGDVVVEIDGKKEDMGIKQLQTYLQMNKNWGDKISLTVLRNQKPTELNMTLPKMLND